MLGLGNCEMGDVSILLILEFYHYQDMHKETL
jgi:hypothetical protein